MASSPSVQAGENVHGLDRAVTVIGLVIAFIWSNFSNGEYSSGNQYGNSVASCVRLCVFGSVKWLYPRWSEMLLYDVKQMGT
jgi:hypothetical protein